MPETLHRDLQSALSDCHGNIDALREALRKITNIACSSHSCDKDALHTLMQDIEDIAAEAMSDE